VMPWAPAIPRTPCAPDRRPTRGPLRR
jgi:hypothetical protein